jgi:hypothetical protein
MEQSDMTAAIGDPDHIGAHNDLITQVRAAAVRAGVTVTLPDTANVGDLGHVDDHNLIAAALAAIAAAPPLGSPTISGATGGTVGTMTENGKTYATHTFDADASFVVPAAGTCDVLLVGAGGSSGKHGGYGSCGGGAGEVAVIPGVLLPAGTYTVTIGQSTKRTDGADGYHPLPGGTTKLEGNGIRLTAIGGGAGGDYAGQGGGCPGACGGAASNGANIRGKGLIGGDGGGGTEKAGGGGMGGNGTGSAPGPGIDVWGTTYGTGGSGRDDNEPALPAPTPNSGNGGNGVPGTFTPGASGRVIIRYETT